MAHMCYKARTITRLARLEVSLVLVIYSVNGSQELISCTCVASGFLWLTGLELSLAHGHPGFLHFCLTGDLYVYSRDYGVISKRVRCAM